MTTTRVGRPCIPRSCIQVARMCIQQCPPQNEQRTSSQFLHAMKMHKNVSKAHVRYKAANSAHFCLCTNFNTGRRCMQVEEKKGLQPFTPSNKTPEAVEEKKRASV
eukprot:TRINITY_DN21244_c0_g2_i1.p1 TRINITY_DN21244_c0_g2~~TRINITY_DN21244_c0_g2_i1.p1  ORF type:complete len:106 (+),score=4.08 TRINITY_DN21244_c0_g2_i1:135-452(+)